MMVFGFDKNHLSDVSVKLSSMSAQPIPPNLLPVAPALAPTLTIEDPARPAGEKDAAAMQWTDLAVLSLQGDVTFQNRNLVKKQPVIGLWQFPF